MLGDYGQTFGKWRYFEESAGEAAIRALVDTDRVWGLGKAARVIADECAVAGLGYSIDINTTLEIKGEADGRYNRQAGVHLSLEGRESAILWDEVLRAGKDDG